MQSVVCEDLSLWEPRPASLGLQWHVLRTMSRQEKALAEVLAARNIRYFLPLVKKTRTYGRRKEVVTLPLFPGYMFLLGTRDELFEADRTRRVASVIEVVDQAKLEHELKNLSCALEHEPDLVPFPYLKVGYAVEVVGGPLRGIRGVIEDRAKKDRLILKIEVLGQATSVEIDGSLLELIEPIN